MIGSRFGHYEILAKLGEGGMGEVYRARDTQLDRDVALKVLPAQFAADADRLQRFEREAKSLAALNHPNIAQVFGIVPAADGRAPAIAMEFVDGLSLDAVKGEMPVAELLPIARQIAAALEAAHESGIVHRDLKPANIKVRDDGTVKVLDFGLAKMMDASTGSAHVASSPTITSPATGLGVILGTAAYMSPEQARGRPIDKRADIWAFGVVVFELLTGSRLFVGDTVSDTIAAVLRQDIPWDRLPAATPPRLRRLLLHCLERDPRNRLRDAGDVRIELDDVLGSAAESSGSSVAVASSDRAASPRSRPLTDWLVLAVLMAAAAGLGWWVATSNVAAPGTPWAYFTPITGESGREVSPVIAPDGDSIAYASDVAGSWDIYVQRIGGRTRTRITADQVRNEGAPAFSPDGKSIAFHEEDTDGGIFIVGATGESERRLSDVGFHPAWSHDQRTIAFCQERIIIPQSRIVVSALSVIDVGTREVRVLAKGDAVQPVWSPSGRRIAYWGQSGGQRDIYTIAASGGEEPIRVTDDAPLDWAVEWAPDGKHLYFVSDRGGSMNLWRVAIDEQSGRALGEPEPVSLTVQVQISRPSFSRDGEKMVFSAETGSTNPVALPIDSSGKVGEPRWLFRQNALFAPTSVSPDGTMLAIFGITGTEDVWVSRTDGTGLRRLTDDQHRDRVPMWSPDGNEVLFYSNRTGKYEIWTIKKDGSGLTQITDRPKEGMNWAFYDPAGRRIWAWASSGAVGVYTFSMSGKTPQAGEQMPTLTVEGGQLRPHGITRDGKRLVGIVLSPAGARLGVGWHDLTTGETWRSMESGEMGVPAWLDDTHMVFALNGRYLAVIGPDRKRRIIGGPFPFEINQTIFPAVAPDRRTLYLNAGTAEADVWMVERRKPPVK